MCAHQQVSSPGLALPSAAHHPSLVLQSLLPVLATTTEGLTWMLCTAYSSAGHLVSHTPGSHEGPVHACLLLLEHCCTLLHHAPAPRCSTMQAKAAGRLPGLVNHACHPSSRTLPQAAPGAACEAACRAVRTRPHTHMGLPAPKACQEPAASSVQSSPAVHGSARLALALQHTSPSRLAASTP